MCLNYKVSHTVVKVSPSVVSLYDQVGVIQDSETVDNVSAELRVNILRLVLAHARAVPGPVGEVANNLKEKIVPPIKYVQNYPDQY